MAKIEIWGDQFEEYVDGAGGESKRAAPFRQQFRKLRGDFCRSLSSRYAEKTVRKHRHILVVFLDFLEDETDVMRFEEITKGMVNSGFRRWYHGKVWDSTTDTELRTTLCKFFQFLDTRGIPNSRVLAALK